MSARIAVLAASACLALVGGCKYPDLVTSDGAVDATTDTASDVGPDGAGGMTVQQVRDAATPSGTLVHLENVVVTAVDTYGNRTGNVWVQQPGGGPFSGISIFGLDLAVAQTLQFRDVVDVDGWKSEFALVNDSTGRTHTDIAGDGAGLLPTITKHGTSMVTVSYVDAAAIAAMDPTAQDLEYKKWEGAYIQLSTVAALKAPTMVGQDPMLLDFTVPAFHVQSQLAAFVPTITIGTCFSAVRGVVYYIYSYAVYPPDSGLTTGTGCP